MKSIYTNQEKIQLVQIGTKMMHEQVMSNPTHKAHHNLNSRGRTIFLLIVYFVIGKSTKSLKEGFSKIPNFAMFRNLQFVSS
jgi:hypothetical protein